MPTIPPVLDGWVANRLISAHFRILRPMVLGHLLNMVMIVVAFAGVAPTSALLIWSSVTMLILAQRWWLGTGAKAKPGARQSVRLIRHLDVNAIVLAVLFAGAVIWLMPLGSPVHQMMLAICATTLSASASYTMRTLYRGATLSIAIMTAALIGSLAIRGTIEALAAAILAGASGLLLIRMALIAHGLFVTRIVRERDLGRSAETVRMLLNDFEDHGSDWLFELDRDDRIVSASKRFADALDVAPETLNGKPFLDLFADGRELTRLVDHLRERRAFRGLALRLAGETRESQRWWSLSGRPCIIGDHNPVRFRGVISDVSTEKQAEERVRHMAHFDGLTGLPNRLFFSNSVNRLVREGIVSKRAVILLIDVDHFKAVNDAMGHPVGDQFLKSVSGRLIDCVARSGLGSEGQTIARLSGDEFAILMAGEDSADKAIRLAEAINKTMTEPFLVQDHTIVSSVSIGMAISPFDGSGSDELIRSAGLALERAKLEGRNCWERFEPGLDVAVRHRHALERDLRNALQRNEMQIYLQPLVLAGSRRRTGFEALLRWHSEERGLVMPGDFIPLAEDTGLIVPLGEWVIRTAIREAAQWDEPLNISVNVSPVQMRSHNLLPTIINVLAETGLDPGRLEIEITEGVLLQDSEANLALLHRMRDLGIRIALDDFGIGYASLNYLRTFPFDKIKIDRSFVADLAHSEDCRAIIRAVVSLANELGMTTLAEGIEREDQLAELEQAGCQMLQGLLFGGAQPIGAYPELRVARQTGGRKAA